MRAGSSDVEGIATKTEMVGRALGATPSPAVRRVRARVRDSLVDRAREAQKRLGGGVRPGSFSRG